MSHGGVSMTAFSRWFAGVLTVCAACLIGGCAVLPHRPYIQAAEPGAACASTVAADKLRTTPEVPDDKSYTLHFVEFDDQGWAFPDGTGTPSRQIDCAIADLRHKLEAGPKNVLSFVYVHGWKHSADNDDRDVQRFRKLLMSRAAYFPDRHVVGIFVGWGGKTVDAWGLNNLTFWGRKNAAHHVADGRVRELFSRIRGLRDYWNGPRNAFETDCDWEPGNKDRCRLRTIMIGHSFGGLILFTSAAPYLLQMLSTERDLPAGEKRQRAARARGIADLIVLLNPAFEGSRYEPVFEASQHYRAAEREPPVLVMLTSTADWATKNAFPVARWFNSIFQYPSSSDDQSTAMRRTPGHIEHYLTHTLCLADKGCPDAPGDADAAVAPELQRATSRRYCGGLVLRSIESAAARPPRSIVWNVRTNGQVIPNHNDIDRPEVLRFIEQVYSDVTGLRSAACDDDYTPATVPNGGIDQASTRAADGIQAP
jgi:hypothetical protein